MRALAHPIDVERPPAPPAVFDYNLAAEASILGGVILRNEVLRALEDLEVDDFFDHRHKVVFQAMRNLEATGRPIDVVTLEVEIEREEKLEAVGGIAFLGELALCVPTADNVTTYADGVMLASDNRRAHVLIERVGDRCRKWPHAPADMLEELAGELQQFRRRSRRGAGGADLQSAIARLVANRTAPIFLTGFASIDERVPLMAGMIALLNGGSGSGKSTWLMQVARHHADTLGPALYVSLELELPELAARIVGQALGEDWSGAYRGKCGEAQMRAALNHPRFRVVDDHRTNASAIRRHVIALQRLYPRELVLVVVDYIQNLEAPGRDDRERVSNAIESLRALAKELGVVLFVASQPSRSSADKLRGGKMVGIDAASAGAETAQLERASYVVLTFGEIVGPEAGSDAARIAVWIAKARMGRAGIAVWLESNGRTGVWSDTGEVATVAEHKAAKAESKSDREVDVLAAALPSIVAKAKAPMSRTELKSQLGGNSARVSKAIAACLAMPDPPIVECGPRNNGAYKIWTTAKALAASILIHTPIPTRSTPVPEQVSESAPQSLFPPIPRSIGAGMGMGGTGDATDGGEKKTKRRNGSRKKRGAG